MIIPDYVYIKHTYHPVLWGFTTAHTLSWEHMAVLSCQVFFLSQVSPSSQLIRSVRILNKGLATKLLLLCSVTEELVISVPASAKKLLNFPFCHYPFNSLHPRKTAHLNFHIAPQASLSRRRNWHGPLAKFLCLLLSCEIRNVIVFILIKNWTKRESQKTAIRNIS